jgi:hypothetical protein
VSDYSSAWRRIDEQWLDAAISEIASAMAGKEH